MFLLGTFASLTLASAASADLRVEMHERFTRATQVQTAVINGDLEATRGWAQQLTVMAPRERGFADVRGRFADLAEKVTQSLTIAEAAARTAEMANACGACHELHDVAPHRFQTTADVIPGESVADRMARHIWSADRMWEALVGRSESAWAAGAAQLLETPLAGAEISDQDQKNATAFAQSIADTGRKALGTARWRDRATVYGELLTACASCHQVFRHR